MAKKLIKYAKFMVSVALIFCMVLPSYAMLGQSDGSSFVTKAEFDSALADFNSRLTSFEAGINSKIDSQVTSFLDRNGIWAGKEQTALSFEFYYKDVRSFYLNFFESCTRDASKRKQGLLEEVAIDKISKNGLCFFETQWNKCWSVNIWDSNNKGNWAYLGTGVGTMELGTKEKNAAGVEEFKTLATIDNFMQINSQPYSGVWVVASADMSKLIAQFFVKKEQKLYCRVYALWEGATTFAAGSWGFNGAGCTLNNVGYKDADNTTKLGIINSATVY